MKVENYEKYNFTWGYEICGMKFFQKIVLKNKNSWRWKNYVFLYLTKINLKNEIFKMLCIN